MKIMFWFWDLYSWNLLCMSILWVSAFISLKRYSIWGGGAKRALLLDAEQFLGTSALALSEFLITGRKEGVPLAGFTVRSAPWLETFLDGVVFGRLYLNKVFAELMSASLFACGHICIGQRGLEICALECSCRGSDVCILDGLFPVLCVC